MNKEEEAEIKRKLEVIWRGMYGDEDNEVPGVVDDVKDVKKAKKYVYMAIGFITALECIYFLIKELNIKIF